MLAFEVGIGFFGAYNGRLYSMSDLRIWNWTCDGYWTCIFVQRKEEASMLIIDGMEMLKYTLS